MKRSVGKRLAACALVLAAFAACADNMVTGKLTPVPPVQKVPPDVDGRRILVADEAVLDSKDPVHHQRANDAHVLRDFREAMREALRLAGFEVVTAKGSPYDVEAKLTLHVDEDTGKVNQVYRCRVVAPDGAEVADIGWTWPRGTYVETDAVFAFATHHLAEEVARSRPVVAYLRQSGPRGPSPAADASVD